ncbi:MAG: TolC family protein [Chloracidobacterium sp.]|nr:TolC family protein [Chloracidobacterium sp.]
MLRRVRTFIIMAAAISVVPLMINAQEPERLTLEQAIGAALRDNTSVKNAEIETEKIGLAKAAYQTRRLPAFKSSVLISQPLTRMAFTIEEGQFGTFQSTGPIPATRTEIQSSMSPSALVQGQVQQPLSQLFGINLNLKKFDVNKDLSREQTRQKRQAITAEVKTAYFQILQTESLLKNADELVKLNREINRVTEQFVMQGVALVSEQMDTGTKLAQAEYDRGTLLNRAASQKEQLNYLMGRDVTIDFVVSAADSMLTIAETDLAVARKRALDQRPELRQARLGIEQSNLDARIKKAEQIPAISLTASYTSPFNVSSFLPKNILSVGISVEWEVFDWGRKKREHAEKKLAILQSENSLKEAESMVLMEVSASFRKLQESADQLRLMQMTQKTASANLDVALNRYQQQAILYKEVLRAEASLTDANTKYQNALLSFWTAKAEFEKALGEEK